MHRSVLVTGGAGYVGSHAVLALRDAGHSVVVIDDLSTGTRSAIPRDVTFIRGDIGDGVLVTTVIEEHDVGAIMHFAGSIVVPDSVEQPIAYYGNNTVNSHALIRAALDCGIERFLFSSTAAVYGNPDSVPVNEDAPTQPINPYGTSKLMTEWMLRDAASAHGIKVACLRYFNVAGADPQGRSGQSTPAATHLIKVACQTAVGLRDRISIFGTDYPTADGTCVRDYIHVSDLADAHVLALDYLGEPQDGPLVLNCGYGHGSSVRQVLDMVNAVNGEPLAVTEGQRRPGDSAALVAGADRIRSVLGWTPKHDDLEEIVRSALEWERRLMAAQA